MDDCVFCRMVAGEIPVVKVYEDPAVLAFLDIGPVSDGHTLVIPKAHCAKVHESDPEILAEVWRRLGRIAGAISHSARWTSSSPFRSVQRTRSAGSQSANCPRAPPTIWAPYSPP